MIVYLDLADLVGLEFRRAVVVNDADASHQLLKIKRMNMLIILGQSVETLQ